MKWFTKKKQPETPTPEMYTEEEMAAVESHIAEHFGKFDNVLHEILSLDIHVDIAIVKPTPERNYYTLVTMGMGAHRMSIPPEVAEHMREQGFQIDRAELMICLPPDWILNHGDFEAVDGDAPEYALDHPAHENWYWPLRWLKIIARLPKENNTWIGYGHTIPNGPDATPFAENTKLGCIMLVPPIQFGELEAQVCEMPDGSQVVFYQMLPLYADEMNFKLENDADLLLEKFSDDLEMEDMFVLDISRPSVVEDNQI